MNHMDFPYLIEMRYEFTGSYIYIIYIFEQIENGTLVICPTLLIFYYFHITKLTRHVFLSKLPLKVSKLIRFSLCLLYIHIHHGGSTLSFRCGFYEIRCLLFIEYVEFRRYIVASVD